MSPARFDKYRSGCRDRKGPFFGHDRGIVMLARLFQIIEKRGNKLANKTAKTLPVGPPPARSAIRSLPIAVAQTPYSFSRSR